MVDAVIACFALVILFVFAKVTMNMYNSSFKKMIDLAAISALTPVAPMTSESTSPDAPSVFELSDELETFFRRNWKYLTELHDVDKLLQNPYPEQFVPVITERLNSIKTDAKIYLPSELPKNMCASINDATDKINLYMRSRQLYCEADRLLKLIESCTATGLVAPRKYASV